MANVIRELFGRLGFEVDNKGAKKFDAQMDRLAAGAEATASKISGVMAGVGASIAAAFGASQIQGFIAEQNELVTVLDNFEASTGIQSERLQQLSFAASKAGVELDDFAQGIVDLSVRAFDAAIDPGNSYAEIFNRIGVSVTDASGQVKDAEALYLDFVDALNKTDDAELRRFALDELLGDAGTRQVKFIEQGRDAIEASANSAEAAATVINKDAREATRSLAITQQVLAGSARAVANAFLVQLAPSLESGAKRLTAFFQNGEAVNKAVKILEVSLGALAIAFASVKVGGLITSLAGLPALLLRSATSAGLLGTAMNALKLSFVALPLAAAGAFFFLEDINTMLEGGESVAGDFIEKNREASGVMGTLARALEQAAPALGALFERLSALGEQLLPLLAGALSGALQALQERLGGALELLLQLFAELGPTLTDALENILPKIFEIVSTLNGLVTGTLGRFLPAVSQTIKAVLEQAGPILNAVTSLLASLIAIVSPLIPAILAIAQLFMAQLRAILPVATGVLAGVAGLVRGLLPVILPVIAIISGAVTTLAGLFSAAFDFLAGIFGPAANAVLAWLRAVEDFVDPLIRKIAQLARAASKIPGLSAIGDLFSSSSAAPSRDIVSNLLPSPAASIQRSAAALSPSATMTSSAVTTGDINLTIQGDATREGASALARQIQTGVADEVTRRSVERGLG